MESTVSRPAGAVTAGSLRQAIAEFAAGQLGKREIRLVLGRALQADPAYGEAIQEFLDAELRARRLSVGDHKELTVALNQPASENIPTEPSAEAPVAPGIYRIDGEGTLILADDFEPSPPPPLMARTSSLRTTVSAAGQDGAAQRAAALPKGTVLRERFRLDQEVARGSMGIVYRATDLLKLDAGANSPEVAVKVINPEFANDRAALKSFQNEVANTQHLSHPNIIHLFELDRDENHYFITMEWLNGEALDALLDRSHGSALPPVQAYAIIEQLCDALAYAHERNVVHADIKPGNVFLTKSGELKLIDFGIARFDESAYYGIEKPQEEQAVALTPAYASCECLEKQTPTVQDDLFSLACLVYRLLSGRRVFGSKTALQAEAEGLQPVRIGGMSDQRWAALSKALKFRREHRQPGVQAFAEEFGWRSEARESQVLPDAEEVAHADTMTLQKLPDGVDFALHDTAKLSSLRVSDPVAGSPLPRAGASTAGDHASRGPAAKRRPDPRSPLDQAAVDDEAAAIDVEAIRAQALASMARKPSSADAGEAVNFFDESADDSAFIPIDMPVAQAARGPGSPAATGQESGEPFELFGTGTAELEALPEHQQPPEAARAQPASPAPAASAASVDTVPRPRPRPRPRPAPGPAQRGEPASPVAVLARKPDRSGSRAGLQAQLLHRLRANPVSSGAFTVVVLALAAMFISLFTGGGDQTVPAVAPVAAVPQAVPLPQDAPDSIGALELPPADAGQPELTGNAGTTASIDAPPVFDTVDSQLRADAVAGTGIAPQPEEPLLVNTVDTGISRGAKVVPVPLGLPPPGASSSATPAGPPAAGRAVRQVQPAADAARGTPVPSPAEPAPVPAPARSPATVSEPALQVPAAAAVPAVVDTSAAPAALLALGARAEQALSGGRLVEPAGDNALAWIQQMRAVAPGEPATLAAEAQVQQALFARAELAVGRNDVAAATRWTDLAAENGADPGRLQQTRSLIADLRKQNAWQAIAAMDRAAKDSGASATSEAQPGEPDAPLPLSTFEFINYVEPVYPQSLGSTPEGWVDVSFTISADGSTRDIEVIGTDLPPRFAAPSIRAVEQWRFRPYERNGAVVEPRSAVRLRYAD